MDDEKFCLLAVGVAILLFAGIFGMTQYDEWKAEKDSEKKEEVLFVREGDEISVDYTGYFQGSERRKGAVFDTSLREIAENDSIPKSERFEEKGTYDDLTFTVGSGDMIRGFEEQVVGKKEGQTFTATITPDKGYGESHEEWKYQFDLIEKKPLMEVINMSHFEFLFPGSKPGVDKNLQHPVFGWDIMIMDHNATDVTLLNDPIYGRSYRGLPWNITIEDISTRGNTYTIKHEAASIGDDEMTSSSVLELLDRDWFRKASSIKGWEGSAGSSIDVSGGRILLDFNKEVAGKTLIFDITINSINRG